ncbi:hypothetical protein ACOSP7_030807 [Xanthoceras sorbifolium]
MSSSLSDKSHKMSSGLSNMTPRSRYKLSKFLTMSSSLLDKMSSNLWDKGPQLRSRPSGFSVMSSFQP